MATVFERVEPGARKANKRHILSCALSCFEEFGIEATTIELIKQRSESSVGTIYHHFGNKEGLIAALFFVALEDQQQQIMAVAERADNVQSLIKSLVVAYLRWVTEQPELARFMFKARSIVSDGAFKERLEERNKIAYRHVFHMLIEAQKKADIRKIPLELFAPLLVGQAESYCRVWLAGRAQKTPLDYADEFALAVWQAFAPS